MAQLVARYLGVVEAASSSLVTQTKHDSVEPKGKQCRVFYFFGPTYKIQFFLTQIKIGGSTDPPIFFCFLIEMNILKPVVL